MWLLLTAPALAHPFESRLYGHQTTLWLTDAAVTVEYAVEIPTARLLSEIRERTSGQPTQSDQDAFNDRLHRDLRDATRLLIDGESVAWAQLEPAEDSGRGDVKFIVYRIALQAPLPATARTLQLIDGNYPDEPSIFQTSVFVEHAWILDASSQLTVEDGVLTASRDGDWRAEEDNRELRLSFRRRDFVSAYAALARLGGIDAALRPSGEVLSTVRSAASAELRSGRLQPQTSLWVLGVAGVLAFFAAMRRKILAVLMVSLSGVLVLSGLLELAGVGLVVILIGAGMARLGWKIVRGGS